MFNQPSLQNVPPIIKRIIFLSLITTFASIFLNVFLTQMLHLPPLSTLLAITPWGVKHGAIYQILTYPFVNALVFSPMSIWGLLGAFFQYYIVFSIGTTFIYQRGQKAFALFFFGCTLITGLVGFALLATSSASPTIITGLSHPIMAMLIFFAFHNPNSQILIFFFPVRAKWAIFGLSAIYLFLDFSNGHFINFFCSLTTLIYAYSYSVLSSNSLGPFETLHSLDQGLIRLKNTLAPIIPRIKSIPSEGKIQSLYATKRQIQKDLYLDLLLDKISKQGKNALSLKERWFLFRYSK
ncbi:hypothetical protein COB21_05140 [Candidatus Aerophobetes bacterium]|uniref:DUF6576 domain-containing protein n=1 Tax=Aerophobetes bacterium TaxID=2030807 RepID=A0A2A4WZL1_UNCAE|nr:MAG: hypothetical protein COB21_05140 [Candidatus Aerophobetes bacterium]